MRQVGFRTYSPLRSVSRGLVSKDAQRCPTTIDPSCNTDQGVRRMCKCDGIKTAARSESDREGSSLLDWPLLRTGFQWVSACFGVLMLVGGWLVCW